MRPLYAQIDVSFQNRSFYRLLKSVTKTVPTNADKRKTVSLSFILYMKTVPCIFRKLKVWHLLQPIYKGLPFLSPSMRRTCPYKRTPNYIRNTLCIKVVSFMLLIQVGSRYLDHLIIERKYAEAAQRCPKLLRGSPSAWERLEKHVDTQISPFVRWSSITLMSLWDVDGSPPLR